MSTVSPGARSRQCGLRGRPGPRWGGLRPLRGTGSQRVLTVRGRVSCRGDVSGCGPGGVAHRSCHWPMGVGWRHRAGPLSAGACSPGLLGLAPLWWNSAVPPGPLPAAACHPPLPWQHVHPATSRELGTQDPSGAQGPVRGAQGGAQRGRDPRRGRLCLQLARVLGGCALRPRGPQLRSLPLGLLPGYPDPQRAGTRAGTRTGRCAGGFGGLAVSLRPSCPRAGPRPGCGKPVMLERNPPSLGVL